jgi:hypothetical protein
MRRSFFSSPTPSFLRKQESAILILLEELAPSLALPQPGEGSKMQDIIPTSRFILHASHDGSLFYWKIDSENLKIINEYEGSNEFLVLMTLEECLGLLMLN